MITLGQAISDNNKRLITFTDFQNPLKNVEIETDNINYSFILAKNILMIKSLVQFKILNNFIRIFWSKTDQNIVFQFFV